MTDFTPCPKTIRLCIEALPNSLALEQEWIGNEDALIFAVAKARAALEALLPDPAEELVNEYQSDGTNIAGYLGFARWLTQNYTLEKK